MGADLDAPHKQRHTMTRSHARLIDEHAIAEVSYTDHHCETLAEVNADFNRMAHGDGIRTVVTLG